MKRMMAVGAAIVLVLCIGAAGLAARAADAAAGGYDAAKAHDPHFSDPTVWPENLQVGKAAYAKETWPKGRVLVWANTGPAANKNADPADPANWLEDGKPATKLLDGNCDLVFPASRTRYEVKSQKSRVQVRHITVESGCSVWWGIGHAGNTWIKKGADYGGNGQGSGSCTGAKNTFMRNDTGKPAMLANGLHIGKAKDASVEFIGDPFGAYDDMTFDGGTVIVGPDCTILAGDRSTQAIYPGSRLILMSGAKFTKRAVMVGNDSDMIICQDGALWAGTPERPITRDCFVALSWKTRERANGVVKDLAAQHDGVYPYQGPARPGAAQKFPVDWHLRHNFGIEHPNDVGMVVLPGGRIEVASADVKKARLVFRANRLPPDSAHFTEDIVKGIPHKIDVVFLGPTVLSGVEFRDVNKGGIMLADPAVRQKWTNVTFGEGNDGGPDELCVPLGDFKPDINVQGHEDYAKNRMNTKQK